MKNILIGLAIGGALASLLFWLLRGPTDTRAVTEKYERILDSIQVSQSIHVDSLLSMVQSLQGSLTESETQTAILMDEISILSGRERRFLRQIADLKSSSNETPFNLDSDPHNDLSWLRVYLRN